MTPARQGAVSPVGQRPTFRTGVTSVAVDVSVRVRNNPVLGLGPDDFQLTDNGVLQHIDLVSLEAIPLDISILLDASASMYGIYNWLIPLDGWVRQLQTQVPQVTSLLTPADRFRVVGFGLEVRELVPMHAADQAVQSAVFPYAGGTSLYDAVFLALLHDPGVNRRHLIVAFTDGDDTTSVLSVDGLVDTAIKSDASVHLVYVLPQGRAPSRRPFPMFERLADSSGGDVHTPLAGRLPVAFERIIESYRSRYLVRYSPASVVSGGWHQLEVRVPRFPNAEIRARRGYFAR